MARAERDFYDRDTLAVARDLVGCYLVRETEGGPLVCRVTETEAYIGAIDKACHAYGGRRTRRTETLYAAPGTAYVYFVYGMHYCLNCVTEAEGTAAAVLIRGGIPVYGVDEICRNRFGVTEKHLTPYQRRNLLNGPGKLCRGLGITGDFNGLGADNPTLYVCRQLPRLRLPPVFPPLRAGRRIGIDYAEEAADFPWRFWSEEGAAYRTAADKGELHADC